MVIRVWHGWTSVDNASVYEALLKTEIFPGIFAMGVAGFLRIELSRRALPDEVEFITVMWFTSLEAIKAFAGDDYETAYVPAAARKVLKRFDLHAQHYEVLTKRDAP